MLGVILKTLLILTLGIVFFQDMKERQVYWFLFPVIGILGGILFYKNTLSELFMMAILLNTLFILLILTVVFTYVFLKFKTSLFKTIGLGDMLLFIVLSLSFSTISFIILFVSSLVFSLLLHLILKKKNKTPTVPLAGYMSLFFILTYVSYWTGIIDSVYIIWFIWKRT